MSRGLLLTPLLLVVGALTGVAAVLTHQLWWGLPLVAAAAAATLVWIGPGWTTRFAFAVGLVGVVIAVLPARPEGGYVVGSTPRGYALLLLALVVLVVAVVTLPRPRRAPIADPLGDTTYHGARD